MLSQRLLAPLEEMAMDVDEVPETETSRVFRIFFEARALARGQANGWRKSLLIVLAARGLSPTEEERALIAVLTDIAVLDRCVRAAVTATSVGAVLALAGTSPRGCPIPARAPTRRPVKKPSSRRGVKKRSSRQ
jgi:hypothetical protein